LAANIRLFSKRQAVCLRQNRVVIATCSGTVNVWGFEKVYALNSRRQIPMKAACLNGTSGICSLKFLSSFATWGFEKVYRAVIGFLPCGKLRMPCTSYADRKNSSQNTINLMVE
jgi:hypothetical protein